MGDWERKISVVTESLYSSPPEIQMAHESTLGRIPLHSVVFQPVIPNSELETHTS